MRRQLDRTLGLYSAITISVGTMIGSAIFVLAGTSYQVAGPSASLSVFLAGLAAFPTAFSFCELVTVIPRAGGGYAYAREAADGGIIGFITGWGFWLAYAMSCGLFSLGFGTFLNYFFPFIPPMVGAYALIFYVMATNIKGVENTGKLQNLITTALIGILAVYMIYGAFFMDMSHQRPFFTEGMKGMLSAMGFLYITYIGYGLVTTASEEVVNPEKIIPRAIIFSLILVTIIKSGVFLIGSSIIEWKELLPSVTSTPLTDTAVVMAGRAGGYIFAFAGILATVSSINTAMMAAARTSFAMGRDNFLPRMFRRINPKTQTPVFSVLVVAFIVVMTTAARNLENISTVTSVFALTGYSFVNVAVMIFRKKWPEEKRAYKVPLYPYMPLAGIAVNIFLVFQLMLTNIAALSLAVAISLAGILYYYLILPKLGTAPSVISTELVPAIQSKLKEIDKGGYKVMVPVASPDTIHFLIDMGMNICGPYGSVQPVHVVEVPEVIPMDSGYYDDFVSGGSRGKEVVEYLNRLGTDKNTLSDPLLMVSRRLNHALTKAVEEVSPSLVLMGWHSSGIAYWMRGKSVHKALMELPVDTAIFKKGSKESFKKVLCPYGGGMHSQESIKLAKRIFSEDTYFTLFHIAEPGTPQQDKEKIEKIMQAGLKELHVNGETKIVESYSIRDTIVTESSRHDIVVMGAGNDWGTGKNITGKLSDGVMERITCHGLIIRKYQPLLRKAKLRQGWSQVRNWLGEGEVAEEADESSRNALQHIIVREVMNSNFSPITPDMRVSEANAVFLKSDCEYLPVVVADSGKLAGLVDYRDVMKRLGKEEQDAAVAQIIILPIDTAYEHENLYSVKERLENQPWEVIPVFSSAQTEKVVGLLNRRLIEQSYGREWLLYLSADNILLELDAQTKEDAVKEICSAVAEKTEFIAQDIINAVNERERQMNTALGEGVAYSHARMRGLSRPMLILARSKRGIEWGASDSNPVNLIFLGLIPEDDVNSQINMIKGIAKIASNDDVRKKLLQCKTMEDELGFHHEAAQN